MKYILFIHARIKIIEPNLDNNAPADAALLLNEDLETKISSFF